MPLEKEPRPAAEDTPCCDTPPDLGGAALGAPEDADDAADFDAALAPFTAFMKAANASGRIDAKSKKLIAVALSIAHKCEPCLRSHLTSARAMGLTRAELDEAAALAVAFGGCTAMMFYKETCKSVFE